MSEFCKYLNGHIRPHNLVSISIYEDTHPNNENVHLSMLHKKDEILLKQEEGGPASPGYKVQTFHSPEDAEEDPWSALYEKACEYMTSEGTDQGYAVTSYNRS